MLTELPALPLLAGCCLALAFAGEGVPLLPALLAALLAALGLLLLGTDRFDPDWWPALGLIALFIVGGAVLLVARTEAPGPLPARVGGVGTVVEEREWGAGRALVVALEGTRYLTTVFPVQSVPEGERIRIEGRIRPLEETRSGFSPRRYWGARGVAGEIDAEKIRPAGKRALSLHSWRSLLRRRIDLVLPPLVRGHLLAVLLGVRDPALTDFNARLGTVHLLAVSGFHVGLVALLGYLLFGWSAAGLGATSLLLWGYVLLTGAAPSALRAAVMLQLFLVGVQLGRGWTVANAVAAAGVLLLLVEPFLFWSVGWRLSMLAALSLSLLAGTPLPRYGKTLLVSPVAWSATAGTIASVFGAVPLAGLLVNLVAVPVYTLLLPLAVICSVPALLGLPGGTAVAGVAEQAFAFWMGGASALPVLLPWELQCGTLLHLVTAATLALLLAARLRLGGIRALLLLGSFLAATVAATL
ncbi:MAG: ComEC/Rec2 family competence protein [Synergistales bacterium]|nr:ComEC/Rec2 family competence protein [Synergistales bacterium]